MATYIRDETGIKQTKVTINLLCNQLLESVDSAFYMELYNSIFRYDCVAPHNFLDRILQNYAEINNKVLELNNK